MKVVLALVFGALVQGQTSQAAPLAAPSSALAPPRSGSSSNATGLKDRQFFVANPIVDAMLVSTLAPKTSTTDSTITTSTSSSSDLTNTLLMASVLNSGNNNQQKRQPPRRQYTQAPQYVQTGPQYIQASGPQYVQASGQYVQASGPQYVQSSVSTQFAPVQTFQQQPQYFAPAPQPRYAPQRSYHNDGYGYDSGSQREDPLKKMVLLNGVMSGNVNPMAAVALDNNKKNVVD